MLNLKVTCFKCGTIFDVNAENIKEKKIVVQEDGKELTVTCFSCEECGQVHMVQIDDENTVVLLSKIKSAIKGMVKKKRQSKILGKRKAREFQKLRDDLAKMRSALVVQYQGKHFIKEGKVQEIVIRG